MLGGHSQAVLDLYLRRNGLGAGDVAKVEALAVPPVSLEQSLRQGQIDVAALTGIFQDKAVAAGGVAKAIEWSRTTPREEVIARQTEILRARGRNEGADALKYWKSWGVAGRGGLMTDREFATWSGGQHRHPLAEVDGLVDAVRDEHDGLAGLRPDAQQLVLEGVAGLRVRVFQKVVLPAAVPSVFTGIRLAGGISVRRFTRWRTAAS